MTGPVTGDAPRLAFKATVPDVAAFSPALAEVEPLNTDATLAGTAAREGDVWSVDAALRTGSGIEATVAGPVTGEGAPRLAFDASVPDLSAFSPALDGIAPLESAATLSGTAAQVDGAFAVDVEAATDSGIEAAVGGTVTGPAPSVAFTASVPDASALSPALAEVGPLQGAATLAGTASQVDGAWSVDVGLDAEGGLAAEVEGTVTGDSPRIAFEVSAPDLRALSPALAEAEPLEGPGTLSGTVARPDGAWDVDVALRTEGGTTADVEGTVTGDNPRIEASVTVPALNRVNPALNDVPALQGTATLDAVVEKDGDAWSVDAALDTEGGIEVRADGTVTGNAPRLEFSARVPELEGFSPAIAEVGPLSGEAVLDGVVERDGDTWEADVTLTTEGGIEATVEGPVTGDDPRLAFAVTVPRLGELSPAFETIPPLQGTATLEGLLTRPADAYVVDVQLRTEGGIEADVEGTVTGASPDVAFTVRVPQIESFSEALEAIPPLTGAAVLEGSARRPGEAWIVDAALDVDGGFRATAEGPVTGPAPRVAFTAAVPDLQDVNPALAAYPALAGRAALEGTLAQTDGAWRLDAALDAPAGITARARGPVTGPDAVSLAFQATVPQIEVFAPDLPPALAGTLSLDGTLDQTPEGFALDVAAAGPLDARATAATVLGAEPLAVDFTIALPSLEPLAPVPGGVDVAGTLQQTEDGFAVTAQGTGPYDVELTADAALGAEGITVTAQGRLPEAGALVPQLSGPVAFDVRAEQRNAIWSVDADLSGAGGLSLSVEGPVTGPNPDVAFRLAAADVSPFALGLSGPLNASGRLFGQNGGYAFEVDASGPLGAQLTASGQATGPGAPQARFDLRVPDVSPLVPDLAGPLRATGTASQGPDGIALDVDLTGPGGTTASVAGTVGSTLSLGVTGQIPLGLANAFIAPNNLAGTARVDLRVDGPPALESVRGTISTSGASLVLPTLRNGLDAIDATVTLAGDRATVDLRATPTSGGVLTLSGPVSLAPPFDGALALRFDGRLEDPNLYTARVIATVNVSGPLAGGATISGDILLDEAEISVPSTGLTAVGELPDVRHVNVTRPVMRTLQRADLDPAGGDADDEGDGADGGGGPVYDLDLRVRAPNRIFVRGRGLDAELGGELFVSGTTANPVISGGFELVRGRLDILEQRFQLDEGRISFGGSLVPFIRLVAITEGDALTASIIVEGPANAPEVRFESTPDVPQEEILAQIFFGRDLSQLSALQALQLANSVATLAGRGSGGLLERLRGNAGLDDLDLTTDADGNTAIRAGKYISDNVYTDVQVDQDGDATVTLNLDITPNLTVRGSAGAAGDTSIGLFFEKDY
ncbi:translocation/assembly module TamB domain-containing protein [Jannaschia sp. W003]|nr:translocation/assembly module TamB domain-containing protein [Jannaschia sp. W003]